MNEKKFFLSDMELDEISTVILGDNPTADILIMKGGCTCAWPKPGMQPKAKAGEAMPRCPDCGGERTGAMNRMSKMMPGPDAVHHERTLDEDDFKHAKKLKRKKSMKHARMRAEDGVRKMAQQRRRQMR